MGVGFGAFTQVGCGNGNLNWNEVRPLIERYLSKISIPIYVHSLHVGDDFVPEHATAHVAPTTFHEFRMDLGSSVLENKGTFLRARADTPSRCNCVIMNSASYEVVDNARKFHWKK